jgi:alpha-beta hydrolase superfamily lysophospholipase
MSVTLRTLRTGDGLDLLVHEWRPTGEPTAGLVVAHGFGEHGGRYDRLARRLAALGIATWVHDQRGHGRSPGQRGHVAAWAEYRSDLTLCVELARSLLTDAPCFLLGHSMGALTVIDQAVRDPLGARGVIASGAPARPGEVAGPVRVALARVMSRLWPRFTLTLPIDPDAISSDPAVRRAYAEDPLVHGRASARWGAELLAAIDRVRATAASLTVPLLLVHGEDDEIARLAGAQEIAAACGDATLRTYPHARHEPHNDVCGEDVAADVAAWIDEHR